jgi:hypothetical protein
MSSAGKDEGGRGYEKQKPVSSGILLLCHKINYLCENTPKRPLNQHQKNP